MIKKLLWNVFIFWKKIFNWLLYLIFASYIVHLVITAETNGARILFSLIGILILAICTYYEYLKKIYSKMINSLTIDSDTKKSVFYKDKLIKRDLCHGFKTSIILFDALLLIDMGKYADCLIHLENNKKIFKSSVDYIFIYYHTQLLCFYYLDMSDDGLLVGKKIMQIKSMNKKKYSPLFSWNEIQAIIFSLQGRNKKAIEELGRVNDTLMNSREKGHLNMITAKCYQEIGDNTNFGKYRKLSKEIASGLIF